MAFYDNDISLFFTDFAVDAVYTPQGGPASTIKVIFNNEYNRVVDINGFAGIESSAPQAVCKTTDAANARHGDTLVINGTTYYIAEIMPDGTGITVLALSRDA